MKQADIISGGLFVLFGLLTIFVIVPVQIDSGGDYGLDPSFFPVALLWLITAVAVLLIVTRLPISPDPSEAAPPLDGKNWLFICGAALFLAAAYFGILVIGFIATSVLLIAIVMVATGARRLNWWAFASIPIIATLVIYYALEKIFIVELP